MSHHTNTTNVVKDNVDVTRLVYKDDQDDKAIYAVGTAITPDTIICRYGIDDAKSTHLIVSMVV